MSARGNGFGFDSPSISEAEVSSMRIKLFLRVIWRGGGWVSMGNGAGSGRLSFFLDFVGGGGGDAEDCRFGDGAQGNPLASLEDFFHSFDVGGELVDRLEVGGEVGRGEFMGKGAGPFGDDEPASTLSSSSEDTGDCCFERCLVTLLLPAVLTLVSSFILGLGFGRTLEGD